MEICFLLSLRIGADNGGVISPFILYNWLILWNPRKIQPDSEWAALREAQTKALKLDQVGMAVTIDIGLADDIHPKNKQEVGRRLALVALAGSYGKNVSSSAPVFQNYIIKGNKMELDFGQKQDGFQIKGTTLKGFTIAGPDRVFYPAEAMVHDGKIILSSTEVPAPLAARYGWQIIRIVICTERTGSRLPLSGPTVGRWCKS